jgi:hypothetical protein
MSSEFPQLNSNILDKWTVSAEAAGILPETYRFDSKVVRDESGGGDFTFGVIRNAYRMSRPGPSKSGEPKHACVLCNVVDEVKDDLVRRILTEDQLPGYVVIPNLFSTTAGHTIVIDSGVEIDEREMYNTRNLRGLDSEMELIFRVADETGFRAFHNSEDAGASIPGHEHWHFTNFGSVYVQVGKSYGFDAAEISDISGYTGVSYMPGFPFSHLVFDQEEPNRITSFLHQLGDQLGRSFDDGVVPHCVAQGVDGRGVLVVPFRNTLEQGIVGFGSGEIAGHYVVKGEYEFNQTDYKACVEKLGKRLFRSGDVNLVNFL